MKSRPMISRVCHNETCDSKLKEENLFFEKGLPEVQPLF